jgi:hypothetical protein
MKKNYSSNLTDNQYEPILGIIGGKPSAVELARKRYTIIYGDCFVFAAPVAGKVVGSTAANG